MVLTLLSPAKTLAWSRELLSIAPAALASPPLLELSDDVAKTLKQQSKAKLKSLMSISDNLAALNFERMQEFKFFKEVETSDYTDSEQDYYRPAALAFDGPAFQGLEAASLSSTQLSRLQDQLCVLSGLYGCLRPLDMIQPYRCEMGTKLRVNDSCENLYEYWNEPVTQYIKERLEEQQEKGSASEKVLVNLASQEYSKVVNFKEVAKEATVVTPIFRDGGKVVAVFAKRARGLMTRYIAKQPPNATNGYDFLKAFDYEGYSFEEEQAKKGEIQLIFNRSKEDREGPKGVPETKKGGRKEKKETEGQDAKGKGKRKRVG
ncbi:unnamed protein product [Chrysoparadoxa australica]